MILRTRNTDLPGGTERAVPVRLAALRWVVGRAGRGARLTARAFTLMELVLVLAVLAMAVAVAAPSMARFFRARSLDSEARQMLSLSRYAQSRAVSEGVPMVLWLKPDEGSYGLRAETTYTGTDDKAVDYTVNSDVQFEVDTMSQSSGAWKITTQVADSQPAIRFTPDGFLSDTSPAWILLKQTHGDENDVVWLALSVNRLNYELQSVMPTTRR